MANNAEITWASLDDSTQRSADMSGFSAVCREGSLTLVVGPIGSGKSTLISGLIGQNCTSGGELYVDGDVCYVGAEPWVQHATLRDNILFGQAFREVDYQQTIKACCLEADLQALAQGDQTVIGDRGITLSGASVGNDGFHIFGGVSLPVCPQLSCCR